MEAIVIMAECSQAQRVYLFIHSHAKQMFVVNYDRINTEAFSFDDGSSKQHSGISKSPISSSFDEEHVLVCMAGTYNNIAQLIAQ